MWVKNNTNELYHYGVKGMKWGVRRYQNEDGSLTNAGKRRLAKYLDKQTIVNDDAAVNLARDLKTNYKTQLNSKINDLRNKRKILDELSKPENDYWDSGASAKDSALAYKQTYDWFKKNDPSYLNEIVKQNGGRTDNLDGFHNFRKTFEGYEDAAWTKGEKKFYKDRGITPEAIDKAWDDYHDSAKSITNDLIGKYGKTKCNKRASVTNAEIIVSRALAKLARDEV